jgi:hypothetical protein
MLKKIFTAIKISLFTTLLWSLANICVAKCISDDISKLYEMIYSPLVPFQPPLNSEGIVSASEEEIFVLRSQHYFDQLKNTTSITIPLETYAVLTKEVPDALIDFETKLRILLPDCQEISLYNGAPIGELEANFSTMLKVTKIGIDSNLEPISQFAANRLKPLPMTFQDLMTILQNDLSLDPEVISSLMPKQIAERYFPGRVIPVSNLSEAALLTFAALGGALSSSPSRVFFIVPKSYAGISEGYSSIIFTDLGKMTETAALNVELTAQILTRLGIQVDILVLKEILTTENGNCGIDGAGRWFQVIAGRKIRNCPFFSLTTQMLINRSYKDIADFTEQNSIFKEIDSILEKTDLDVDSTDS